ncbi:hypothetical protein ACKWMY_27795 [Serratia sp. J2]
MYNTENVTDDDNGYLEEEFVPDYGYDSDEDNFEAAYDDALK